MRNIAGLLEGIFVQLKEIMKVLKEIRDLMKRGAST